MKKKKSQVFLSRMTCRCFVVLTEMPVSAAILWMPRQVSFFDHIDDSKIKIKNYFIEIGLQNHFLTVVLQIKMTFV